MGGGDIRLPKKAPSAPRIANRKINPPGRTQMNKNTLGWLIMLTMLSAFPTLATSQESSNAAAHQSPAVNEKQCSMDMEARGDVGMGFSQAKTTHHFILTKDGGVISVETNDANDEKTRDQIRMHLAHIAKAFAAGDFDIPMFVHDKVPPGVSTMQSKKDAIQYRTGRSKQGGQVVITTRDPQALAAIHEFLSFQIREHKTGDSLVVR
jgi:hypothetical protein